MNPNQASDGKYFDLLMYENANRGLSAMNVVAWYYYRNYHGLHGKDRVEWQDFVCMQQEHTWPSWAQVLYAQVSA